MPASRVPPSRRRQSRRGSSLAGGLPDADPRRALRRLQNLDGDPQPHRRPLPREDRTRLVREDDHGRRKSIRVLFDNGTDPSIGSKPLEPITQLREDKTGAYYEVNLLDVDYTRSI